MKGMIPHGVVVGTKCAVGAESWGHAWNIQSQELMVLLLQCESSSFRLTTWRRFARILSLVLWARFLQSAAVDCSFLHKSIKVSGNQKERWLGFFSLFCALLSLVVATFTCEGQETSWQTAWQLIFTEQWVSFNFHIIHIFVRGLKSYYNLRVIII